MKKTISVWVPVLAIAGVILIIAGINIAMNKIAMNKERCDEITSCDQWLCWSDQATNIDRANYDLNRYQICQHDWEVREYGHCRG